MKEKILSNKQNIFVEKIIINFEKQSFTKKKDKYNFQKFYTLAIKKLH